MFCGLHINNREDGIHVSAKDCDNLTKAVLNAVDLEGDLNVEEERWVRPVIGTLKSAASIHRPDMSYLLAIALGNLNNHRQKLSIREANGLIDRYHGNRSMQLIISSRRTHLGDGSLRRQRVQTQQPAGHIGVFEKDRSNRSECGVLEKQKGGEKILVDISCLRLMSYR